MAAALIFVGCGGGGGGDVDNGGPGGGSSNPAAPSSPTAPSVSTPAGEPTSEDWWNLSSQLPSIAIEALRQAIANNVAAGSATTQFGFKPFLDAPSRNVAAGGAYFCCGKSNTQSYLAATGTVQPASGGTSSYVLDFASNSSTLWSSSSLGTTWNVSIPIGGLKITSNLTVSGGTYQAPQTFRVHGSISYVANGVTKTQPIDLTVTYTDFQTSAPTATGQIGPVPMDGTTLPAPPSPETEQRCSMPREGCGSLVSGNYPCTKWPPCPGTQG
jgi:hypothetical protein